MEMEPNVPVRIFTWKVSLHLLLFIGGKKKLLSFLQQQQKKTNRKTTKWSKGSDNQHAVLCKYVVHWNP